jgi:hypothetical protein
MVLRGRNSKVKHLADHMLAIREVKHGKTGAYSLRQRHEVIKQSNGRSDLERSDKSACIHYL